MVSRCATSLIAVVALGLDPGCRDSEEESARALRLEQARSSVREYCDCMAWLPARRPCGTEASAADEALAALPATPAAEEQRAIRRLCERDPDAPARDPIGRLAGPPGGLGARVEPPSAEPAAELCRRYAECVCALAAAGVPTTRESCNEARGLLATTTPNAEACRTGITTFAGIAAELGVPAPSCR